MATHLDISAGHRPVRVTARLEAGLAVAGGWGIALDGLLAAQLHATRKAAGDVGDQPILAQADPIDLDLPLSRCIPEDPQLWHWAATTAHPADGHGLLPEQRYYGARTDSRHLEALTASLPERLRDREGRFRARWAPLLVTVCSAVHWHALGDPEALTALLSPIPAIGKQRRNGQGRVLTWQVEILEDLDPFAAAHLHPDGTLGRPTPPSCLAGLDLDVVLGRAGLRPPYIHPARQHTLALPAT